MATFPEEGRLNELKTIAGPGGVNLWLHLFVNPVEITKDTTIGDLVEAAWSSYQPYNSSLWGEPFVDTNGDAVLLSPVILFTGPDVLPGATVHGWFVTLGVGVGESLWFLEALPQPQTIELPTDQLPLRVQARLRYLEA